MEDDLAMSLVVVPANGSSSAAVNLAAEAGARVIVKVLGRAGGLRRYLGSKK